jgi:hypothetical protein
MSIPNFIRIQPLILKLNHVDRQTNMVSPVCIHFVSIIEEMYNEGAASSCDRIFIFLLHFNTKLKQI